MNENKPREFWIDPNYCDDDIQNCFDAFSEKPTQGDPQWIYNLIHVREVLPTDKTPEQIREDAIREVVKFFIRDYSHDVGEWCAERIEMEFLK